MDGLFVSFNEVKKSVSFYSGSNFSTKFDGLITQVNVNTNNILEIEKKNVLKCKKKLIYQNLITTLLNN